MGIRDDCRMLISKVGEWLHGNWTRRYCHWHWKGIWRWSHDNWMVHCSPWKHSPELLLILIIQVINIRFKRSLFFSEIIFLQSQLKMEWNLNYFHYYGRKSTKIANSSNKKITSRDSSFSVAYSSLSLLTWEVRSFSNWIVSLRMVALSFLGLSGSAFQNLHSREWFKTFIVYQLLTLNGNNRYLIQNISICKSSC